MVPMIAATTPIRIIWARGCLRTARESIPRYGETPRSAGAMSERRRRRPVVAAEGLGELGRLAVSHRQRDPVDGRPVLAQELGGPHHADLLDVGAEGGLARLGEGTLELAPGGGHPPGHVVQGQVPRIFGPHDRCRVLEQLAAALDRRRALCLSHHYPRNVV